MKLRDNFDSEIMAWQLIDDKSFWMLVSVLKELKAYRSLTCDYCGLSLGLHEDARISVRSCEE